MFGLVRRGAALAARMRACTIAVQHFFATVLLVAVDRSNADADVVKDMVCIKKVRESKKGGERS